MQSKTKSGTIVVIGSCCVDFIAYAQRLPKPGETLLGTKFSTGFGGKGANQCVAAANLGGNTYMICRLGSDQWGQNYKENFIQVGVNVEHVYFTPNVTSGIAQISVAENGENQIVMVPGSNNYLSVEDVEHSKELIKNADVIIGQLETPFETTLEAFKLNQGIRLFNAAPASNNIEKILPYCTILCVNESEAFILTGLTVTITNAATVLKKLTETGCETVIITLGPDGAVYLSKNENVPIHVPSQKVTAVDTTGAGDAFVGALATFLVSHKEYPLHQIIGAACHVASLSVTKEGTQSSFPKNVSVFDKDYEYINL